MYTNIYAFVKRLTALRAWLHCCTLRQNVIQDLTAVVLLENFFVRHLCQLIIVEPQPSRVSVWFDERKVVAANANHQSEQERHGACRHRILTDRPSHPGIQPGQFRKGIRVDH